MNERTFQAMRGIMDVLAEMTGRCIYCRGDVLCEPCETNRAEVLNHLVTIINDLEPDSSQRVILGMALVRKR